MHFGEFNESQQPKRPGSLASSPAPNRPAGALSIAYESSSKVALWPKSAVCFFRETWWISVELKKGVAHWVKVCAIFIYVRIYVKFWNLCSAWWQDWQQVIKMETLYIHMPYNLLTYWCWLDLIGDLLFVFCLFHMPRTCYDSGSAAFLYTAPKDVGEVGWMDLQTFKGR